MDELFLHTCCGPCASVAVPAWRREGVEPELWFWNPNIQPEAEHARRLDSLMRFATAEGVGVLGPPAVVTRPRREAWGEWAEALAGESPELCCRRCLRLRMLGAAEAAANAGATRFSTT